MFSFVDIESADARRTHLATIDHCSRRKSPERLQLKAVVYQSHADRRTPQPSPGPHALYQLPLSVRKPWNVPFPSEQRAGVLVGVIEEDEGGERAAIASLPVEVVPSSPASG